MRARSPALKRLTTSAARRPGLPIRMSSGPSARKEKPRSAWSSCMEETPMSSTTPSTALGMLVELRERSPAPAAAGPPAPPPAPAGGDRVGVAVDGDDRRRPPQGSPACSRRRRKCRRRCVCAGEPAARQPAPPRGEPGRGGPVRQRRRTARRGPPSFRVSSRTGSGAWATPCLSRRKPHRGLRRHGAFSRSGSQIWKKAPRPTKATSVDDAGMLAHEVGHHDAAILIELQEGAIAMDEERHVVRGLQERILPRDPLLVAVEQIEPADVHRRHVQSPQRIELDHSRASAGPSGNAPGRRPAPSHRSCSLHSTEIGPSSRKAARAAAPLIVMPPSKRPASAGRFPGLLPPRPCNLAPGKQPQLPGGGTLHLSLIRKPDWAYGIAWDLMGVNGNGAHRARSNARRSAAGRAIPVYRPLRLTKR